MIAAIVFDPSSHLELLQKIRGFETVVQMVNRGQLRPDVSGTTKLPKQLQYLSQNEQNPRSIWIESRRDVTRILFYTTTRRTTTREGQSLLNYNESGYAYCSDGLPPGEAAFEKMPRSGLTAHKINSQLFFVTIDWYD